MQITIADVDQDGRALQTGTTFALCGQVRAMGESDDSLNRLATKAGRAYSLTGSSLCMLMHLYSPPERLVIPKVDAPCIAPTSLYHCSLFRSRISFCYTVYISMCAARVLVSRAAESKSPTSSHTEHAHQLSQQKSIHTDEHPLRDGRSAT